ncbi:hypothetical protein LguiB_005705 [Lonicera macranthoides]
MVAKNNNGGDKKLQKSYFDVLGICCSSEVPLIEKILKPLEGVNDVSVIVPSRTVIVLHDTLLISQLQILKVLNQARLEANVRTYGEGNNYRKKWPSPSAVICGVLLLLSFLKYIYHPFKWLAVAAVAADAVMSSLVSIVPQRAILAESGEEVSAGDVMLNTLLAVKDGEIIPIDGIVVQGKCEVDEKTLTGESFPVPKEIDSTVWAGTINLSGYITIRTTALAANCVVARMATLVEEAQLNKSKTQRFIDKCTKYYTPAVVVIAICIAIVPTALKVHNLNKWLHLALVVVVSGCPCALILSTPVATYCALSKAASSGLLVKGAEYLETLSKIKIMAFDKTGTITRGEFVVTDFQNLSDAFDLETLLRWVSSIESKSSHPMAAALVDYAKYHSVEPKPEKVDEFQNFPGEGIYGRIDGKDIYVGNRKIVARAGCETVPTLEGDANEGKSIGYIFSGSSPAGVFSLSDICRTGVKEAMNELKSMGIKTAMLTGDSQAAASYAQEQLGGALEDVRAELLPEDKSKIIKEFQNISRTAMVGDGLNDAAALATADVGISMGISGSALAMETGQIILLSNDIRKIPKAVRLARKTQRKVIENVIISIATKAGILALALAGHPLVWAAVLADVGTCLLVIFNSMLLLGAPRFGGKCGKSYGASHHSHGHKHGSHSSRNTRQDCCSGTRAEAKCTTRKCSSKACDPIHEPGHLGEKHGGCLYAHQQKEEKKPDHEHADQHHCPGTTVEAKCTTPKCSTKTCTPKHDSSNKCSSLAEKHGHLHARPLKEEKQSDHGPHAHNHCCPRTTVEAKCTIPKCSTKTCASTHDSGLLSLAACNSNKSSSSAQKHGGCLHADKPKDEMKHCCSGTTIETKCSTPKCSTEMCAPTNDSGHLSSGLSKNNKCSSSAGKHGGCAHADKTKEEKKQCCSSTRSETKCTTQNFSSNTCSPKHDPTHSSTTSCENNKCPSLPEKHTDHGPQAHKHCEHGNHSHLNEAVHHVEPHRVHCGSNHCTSNHLQDYITEEEIGNMVKECCKYYSSNHHEVHLECKNHGSEYRHVGGCCDSFRKECCGKDPHFGVGFTGGLSEIVIE